MMLYAFLSAEAVPAVAVMVAVPGLTPVTVPPLTDATEELELDQLTFFPSETVAVSVFVSLVWQSNVIAVWSNVTVRIVTVISQLAETSPTAAVTVAVPTSRAVTVPFLTVTTSSLLLVQVISASSSETVAFNRSTSPTQSAKVLLSSSIVVGPQAAMVPPIRQNSITAATINAIRFMASHLLFCILLPPLIL